MTVWGLFGAGVLMLFLAPSVLGLGHLLAQRVTIPLVAAARRRYDAIVEWRWRRWRERRSA